MDTIKQELSELKIRSENVLRQLKPLVNQRILAVIKKEQTPKGSLENQHIDGLITHYDNLICDVIGINQK